MSGTYSVASDTSDFDLAPPMCGIHRPPQFPIGKTSTALDEMDNQTKEKIENQFLWFFNQGEATKESLQNSRYKKYKRVVNLIFVNNSLIEADQWRNRIIRRGKKQVMRVFSSKSDVNNSDRLYSLITEGECDPDTDEDIPVDYVIMCSHPRRFANLCDRSPSGVRSILERLLRYHSDICVVIWFDEADKFSELLKTYIPRFKKFPNVARMVAITATPFTRFWDIMHTSGYSEIDMIGVMPDAGDYRRLKDHNLIYTDEINIKAPYQHFKYILENPGALCYTKVNEKGGILERRHLPIDLKENRGRIMFVPGEIRRATHMAICNEAIKYKKNCLVINGKDKAFFLHTGGEPLNIRDYKDKMVKAHKKYRGVSFVDMSDMDIAVAMYNDPSLKLKDSDLVITGFYCVERGVTFNRPDFQFTDAILSRYHYEDEDDIDSIVQLAGRFHGNKEWVPAGINIYAPNQVLTVADERIQSLIDFFTTAPKTMQYADILPEPNGIPIMATMSEELLTELSAFGNLTEKKKKQFQKKLQEAEATGDFSIIADFNKPNRKQVKFNLKDYVIDGKRICGTGDKVENYRFPQFYEHHITRKGYGQSVKEPGRFVIDIAAVPIKVNDEVTLEVGTAFISFIFKAPMEQDNS